MAITATAKLQLPVGQLPVGSTNDTLSDFSAETTSQEFFEFTINPASSVDDNTQATALTNIKADVKSLVESSFAPNTIGLNASDTIVGDAVITSILRGWSTFETADRKNQYKVATDVFVVNGYFIWHT